MFAHLRVIVDTFPWPQTPTKGQIAEVAAAAVALRGLRREIMGQLGYSLRALYRTLEKPGANPLRAAHTRLDPAIRAAYAMPANADPPSLPPRLKPRPRRQGKGW